MENDEVRSDYGFGWENLEVRRSPRELMMNPSCFDPTAVNTYTRFQRAKPNDCTNSPGKLAATAAAYRKR